jgi:hypothetical protein
LPRVPGATANRIVTSEAIAETDSFSFQSVSSGPVPEAVSSEARDAANERMARSKVASMNARENSVWADMTAASTGGCVTGTSSPG